MLNVLVIGKSAEESAKTLEVIAAQREMSSIDARSYNARFTTYDAVTRDLPVLNGADIVVLDDLHKADGDTGDMLRYLHENEIYHTVPVFCSALGHDEQEPGRKIEEIVTKALGPEKCPPFISDRWVALTPESLRLYLNAARYYRVFAKDVRTQPAA